jgi:hypothetical protein
MRGHLLAGLLHEAEALLAQAQELEVLQDDLRPGPGEVQGEGWHVAAEIVHVEDQVLGQVLRLAPERPSNSWIYQPELMARGLDGHHAVEPEIPDELWLDERGDESTGCCVDVHRDIHAALVLVGI